MVSITHVMYGVWNDLLSNSGGAVSFIVRSIVGGGANGIVGGLLGSIVAWANWICGLFCLG